MDAPDNLLKSALEKVVFFECRIDQLERDLETMTGERDRLKTEFAEATGRELRFQQERAQAHSQMLAAVREAEEWKARAGVHRQEREAWLTKVLDLERIRTAGDSVEGGLDLASFISELRAEIDALREGRPVERPARLTLHSSTAEAATRLEQAGRIGLSEDDRAAMVRSARFETRAEETVFAFSLRELASPFPDNRAKAAERLRALGTREAAAALAAALNRETSTIAKAPLIEALAATAGIEALPLLGPHLAAEDIGVRLAALDAAVKIAKEQAKGELDRALGDVSPRVRRRAALLASTLGVTVGAPLLARGTGDSDAGVRRVSVLALATFGGELARRALVGAADDDDAGVRRAAWQGLGRLFGEPLLSVADEPSARRRRELRRLEVAPLLALRLPEPAAKVAPEPVPNMAAVSDAHVAGPSVAAKAPERVVTAELPSPLAHDPELEEQVIAEVATSLRGRSLQELESLGAADRVERTTATLVGQGRLLRRNQRFFLA